MDKSEISRRPRNKLPYFLAFKDPREPGASSKRKKLTVDQFVSLEYLPYIRAHLRSWRTSEQMLRRHVSPVFGTRPLRDISRREVRELQVGLLKDGYTIGTSNRCLATLSSLFSYAEYLGYIPLGLSPCYKVAPLPRQQRTPYLAPPEKVCELMSALEQNDSLAAKAIHLMILTGARKSEILKAQWTDVDWENKRMRSNRDTHGTTRWIDMPDRAMEILHKLYVTQSSPWLFPGKGGDKPLKDVFQFWKKIRGELGIPQMKIEDLRYNEIPIQIRSVRDTVE